MTGFSPQGTEIVQNRTSSVTVSVVLGPSTNFKRATFDLSYATSEIFITSCNLNTAIVTGTCTNQGSGNYLVDLTTSSASGQTGTVQVLTLSLRGLVVGASTITFSNLAFTNAAGTALTVNTTQQLNLTIVAPTATATNTATWTASATSTVTNTPGPSPTWMASATPTGTQTSTPFGWVLPTATPTPFPTSTAYATPSPSPTIGGERLPVEGYSGRNQFSSPRAIAVAADGSIYVADTRNNRVKRLAADGTTLSIWGAEGGTSTRAGTLPGEFSSPAGIAVDGSGNVLVSDYGNHRVQKFTGDGAPLAQWGTYGSAPGQFAYPRGVAVANSGDIYVADTNNQRVQVLSALGTPVATFDVQFWPEGVLAIGNRSFVATGLFGSCAARIDRSSGRAAWTLNGWVGLNLANCAGISLDTDGSLVGATRWHKQGVNGATSGYTLVRVDTDTGEASTPFGPSASTCVLEVDTGSNEICIPKGVAVEPGGSILVTDVGRNALLRIGRDGTVLATWGLD